MKVYKYKCNKCKEKTQTNSVKTLFLEGCALCKSKSITIIGYGEEDL